MNQHGIQGCDSIWLIIFPLTQSAGSGGRGPNRADAGGGALLPHSLGASRSRRGHRLRGRDSVPLAGAADEAAQSGGSAHGTGDRTHPLRAEAQSARAAPAAAGRPQALLPRELLRRADEARHPARAGAAAQAAEPRTGKIGKRLEKVHSHIRQRGQDPIY